MKKRLFLILALALILSGCSLLGLPGDISFDNDDIIPVDGMEGYYLDSDLAFCAEIRGSYKSDRPFTLDDEDENRIFSCTGIPQKDLVTSLISSAVIIPNTSSTSCRQTCSIATRTAIISSRQAIMR